MRINLTRKLANTLLEIASVLDDIFEGSQIIGYDDDYDVSVEEREEDVRKAVDWIKQQAHKKLS